MPTDTLSHQSGDLSTATARSTLRWLGASLGRHRLWTLGVVASSVLAGVLQVVPVLMFGYLIDTVAEGGPRSALLSGGAALLVTAVLAGVFAGVSTAVVGRLGATVLAELREAVVRTVLTISSRRIEQVGRGDVLSRVGDDVAVVSRGVRDALPPLLSAIVLVTVATVGLFGVDWRLGLAGACAVPMYGLALRWYLPRSGPLYREQRRAQARRAHALVSSLDGIDTVRAYRLEPVFRTRISEASLRVRDLGIEAFRVFSRFVARENRSEFVGFAAIVVVGWFLVRSGASSIGAVTAAALLFHRLFNPIGTILFTFDTAQQAAASLARLVGALTEGDDGGVEQVSTAPVRGGPLRVQGVRYRYPGTGTDALDGIDLELPAGTTLALVGTSGAGKSTLAGVVAGVLEPSGGSVRFADLDVHALGDADRRARITLVTQEAHLFAGSLLDDLRLARPDATETQIASALEVVGASWVAELPQGLHSRIGAGGAALSPMQVAQVSLARILLADTPVVVLDEATAEAGSHEAAELEAAAAAVCSGRTAVVVAHRLTQARDADRIAVMEHGRIVEYGTHDELLSAGGRYESLWTAWTNYA